MSNSIPISCYSVKMHIKVWSFKSVAEAARVMTEMGKFESVSKARTSIEKALQKPWKTYTAGMYWVKDKQA